MGIEDTREELYQYGKWASVKANRGMWYQSMDYSQESSKSDPIMISEDRALFLDGVLSSIKNQDELGYEALTCYLIQRKTHAEIGEKMKCSRKKAASMVANTIYMIHGVLIAKEIVLYA